ncbi:MAG: ComEA family DNA-binding protein [Anaerolineae bacterium]|jgi:competence protein ComEA|nr:ComEA family DNA-binding protein [Anaerolineae bacterium]
MPEPESRWERWGLIGAFVMACLITVAGIAAIFANQPQPVTFTINPPPPTVTPGPTATPAPVVVYITGAVQQPNQLLTMPPGSRVADVIEAVGGFTDAADMARINIAGFVQDGQQIHVPAVDEVFEVVEESMGVSLIDVNSAEIDELTQLPGVGPALAERIIAYRQANGRFTSLEDLDAVSGIGEAMLGELEGRVIFGP